MLLVQWQSQLEAQHAELEASRRNDVAELQKRQVGSGGMGIQDFNVGQGGG